MAVGYEGSLTSLQIRRLPLPHQAPQFKVEMGRKSYFLWISEESGAIMDVKDTHTLYELSNKSVEQMNLLVTSKFY